MRETLSAIVLETAAQTTKLCQSAWFLFRPCSSHLLTLYEVDLSKCVATLSTSSNHEHASASQSLIFLVHIAKYDFEYSLVQFASSLHRRFFGHLLILLHSNSLRS